MTQSIRPLHRVEPDVIRRVLQCQSFAHGRHAPRVVDIDHGARVAQQRGRDRVRDRGGHLAALANSVRDADDRTVDLIRDVEGVAVRDYALHCVVVVD